MHFECSIAVSTDCSIREYRSIVNKLYSMKYPPNMLELCWYCTPAYNAF